MLKLKKPKYYMNLIYYLKKETVTTERNQHLHKYNLEHLKIFRFTYGNFSGISTKTLHLLYNKIDLNEADYIIA